MILGEGGHKRLCCLRRFLPIDTLAARTKCEVGENGKVRLFLIQCGYITDKNIVTPIKDPQGFARWSLIRYVCKTLRVSR
jgi:hypothetical protein